MIGTNPLLPPHMNLKIPTVVAIVEVIEIIIKEIDPETTNLGLTKQRLQLKSLQVA